MIRSDTSFAARAGAGVRKSICAGAAGLLIAGLVQPAFSQTLNNPQNARFFAGCVLPMSAVRAIEDAIGDASITGGQQRIPSPDLDFIVVYAIDKDSNGQNLAGGGTTGPILCRSAQNTEVVVTSEDTPIENADILDPDEALVLRYQDQGSGAADRVCHSVENNVDCVDVCEAGSAGDGCSTGGSQ